MSEVSETTIYTWRRHDLVDRGALPDPASGQRAELREARAVDRHVGRLDRYPLGAYAAFVLYPRGVSLLRARFSVSDVDAALAAPAAPSVTTAVK